MIRHKLRSKFGAVMRIATNKTDSKVKMLCSRVTKRKLERQKDRKHINL